MAAVTIDLRGLGALTPTIVNAQLALQGLPDLTGSTMVVTSTQMQTMKSWPQSSGVFGTTLVDGLTYNSTYGAVCVQVA